MNAGIRAVRAAARQASKPIRVMLHIAQPENVLPSVEFMRREYDFGEP